MTDLTTVARLLEQLVAGNLEETQSIVLLSSHATMEHGTWRNRRPIAHPKGSSSCSQPDWRRELLIPQKVQMGLLMRRGYVPVAVPEGLPVRALDIEWEEEFEEQIAYVISRLDELGDIVDGKIDENEMTELILMLKQ